MTALRRAYVSFVLLIAAACLSRTGPSVAANGDLQTAEGTAIHQGPDRLDGIEDERAKQKEKVSLDLLDTYDRNAGLLQSSSADSRPMNRICIAESTPAVRPSFACRSTTNFSAMNTVRYVVAVYKAGPVHDLELSPVIILGQSVRRSRNEYLKRFSRQRKQDADAIARRKHDLEQVEARLRLQLGDQRRVIEEKANEETRLASLADDRRKMVVQIRRDRKLLQQSLERQTRAAKELEDMISQLIETERIRKNAVPNPSLHERLPQPAGAGNFAARRGHLRWPVAEGSIVAQFGAQRHPTLKTVTLNPRDRHCGQSRAPL